MLSTTAQLLAKYRKEFERASNHALTQKLCNGSLTDRTLYIYLLQDRTFFEMGLKLICKIASMTPEVEALITLAKKIGFFASDENDYFHKCLSFLEKSLGDRQLQKLTDITISGVEQYVNFLVEMTKSNEYSYAYLITYLWVAEECYSVWAHNTPKAKHLHWKHQTWIDLHDGDHFIVWCEFLRNEVNNFSINDVEDSFLRTVNAEYIFFESCNNA